MKYEILGRVFVISCYGYYLTSINVSPGDFFNDAMGFDNYPIRNRFIEEELGIECYCYAESPEFKTKEDLETFIKWFKNKYERPRIILKREQIKNL